MNGPPATATLDVMRDDLLSQLDLEAWGASRPWIGGRALARAEALVAAVPPGAPELDEALAEIRQVWELARRRRDRRLRGRLGLLALNLSASVLIVLGLGLLAAQSQARLDPLSTVAISPGPVRTARLVLGPDLGADEPVEEEAPPPAKIPDPAPLPETALPEERQVDIEPLSEPVAEILPPQPDAVVQPQPSPANRTPPEPSKRGGGQALTGEAGGLGYTALSRQAPMPFQRLGDPLPGRRSARVGLHVAQAEVNQKQWVALMGLDLGSVSGHWDHPAEAMTWCDAIRFANALSRHEGFRPSYKVDARCEQGAEVRWDPKGEGFRLLTEEEWEALADGGQSQGVAGEQAASINNRGLGVVSDGASDEQHGLLGLRDNAREWVWGRSEGRSVARGCTPGGREPCRLETGPAEVPLGVGLRLARGAP